MLPPGETSPEARDWTTPNDHASLREIAGEGPMLLLFYLFDWSST
jgi:hypothetical protein